ncbi:MAG TPA: lactate racemase domain-containing protein [Terriglobia bacterium]|nr:lactate racemase domain-containing protein [Terriglobia bacterium]
MPYPRIFRVQQNFDATHIGDIPGEVRREMSRLDISTLLKAGDTVAVTAGSRGIANIATIIKSVVDELRALKTLPFIIPAMGSHGGATAEGQIAVLERYGITEASMGVPIRATMETAQIGETPQGIPVFVDKFALSADHIAVVNRIKPHTDFDGEIESGTTKMMAIGLGKRQGAIHYHRANIQYGYYTVITSAAAVVLQKCKILFALGIVENAYDQTAIIEAMSPSEISTHEKQLLRQARAFLARIPFDFGDVLIVDEMGKNISGTGIDTNVVGRTVSQWERPPIRPRFNRIVVRDLSPDTYGNATGVGLADIVTRRLVDKIDFKPTYINAITSTNVEGSRIPLTCATDQEAVETAISTSGVTSAESCRLVWIKNTLKLDELIASESYLDEIQSKTQLRVIEPLGELAFTKSGDLAARFQ